MNTTDIITIDLQTNRTTILIKACCQYDEGLKIRLANVPEHNDFIFKVEMCNAGDPVIKYTIDYSGQDIEIPEDLLTDGRNIQVFLVVSAIRDVVDI